MKQPKTIAQLHAIYTTLKLRMLRVRMGSPLWNVLMRKARNISNELQAATNMVGIHRKNIGNYGENQK